VPFRLPGPLPLSLLTRFAPAPTGYLHLGHAANAVWAWGIARAVGGRVLLRVEDHDRSRCRPEYESALLDDLDWLGLEPDVAPTAAYRAGSCEFRQSERGVEYERALAALNDAGLVYACDCSRKSLATEAGDVRDVETPYNGRCRGLAVATGRGLRVRIAPGSESFDDLRMGAQAQDPSSQCGDLLVRDRLGHWTYQFAVTVDDWREGVNLIVRGEDLLSSTGRQLRLARLLGRTAPPGFLHHPLIRNPGGGKLSKANRDTGLRELRAGGVRPDEVLGAAAHATGLLAEPGSLAVARLGDLFATR
jgi:glutamyl-tRNA synthetase/glutamyl-Q tRNA(Asp) synthetase